MLIKLLEIANIAITFAAWLVLLFFTSRCQPLPARRFWIIMAAACVLQLAGFLLFIHKWGYELPVVNLYYVCMAAFRVVLVFCIYRRQLFQNLFFLFSAMIIIAFAYSTGTIIESSFLGQDLMFARLINRIAVLITCIAVLPPMILVLRRLNRQLSPESELPLWRLIWAVPLCLLVLVYITSPVQLGRILLPGIMPSGAWLFFSRLLIMVCLWMFCYIIAEVVHYSKSEEAAHRRAESAEQDLRQREKLAAEIPKEYLVICGPLTLNSLSAQAFLQGEDLLLAPKEFSALLYFVRHEDELVYREAIYEAVWQQPMPPKDRALTSTISRLRNKIEDSGCHILAVRGKGYRFERESGLIAVKADLQSRQ